MVYHFNLSEDADDHAKDSTRLKTFPFDSFRYNFAVCMANEVNLHTTADIDVCIRHTAHDGMWWNTSSTSGEHNLVMVSYGVATHGSPNVKAKYADIVFSLHVTRDRTFYVNKVFTPLLCIYVFALLSYAYAPLELEARMGLLSTMFLTLFAIQWTVSDRLPRTPHTTVIDETIWCLVVSLLVIAVGSAVSYRLALADGVDGEDDSGWGDSRASHADYAFLALSLLAFLVRGVMVWLATLRRRRCGGGNCRFKNGVGMASKVELVPGKAFRFYPGRPHAAASTVVDDVSLF